MSNFVIQINGRIYTSEDIAQGEHQEAPAITGPDESVVNVCRGAVVGIQAREIHGDINFS